MIQDPPPDDIPMMFAFRPWNPQVESWDDFMSAVERGYSQYLDRCRCTITADQIGRDPEPDELDSDS